MIKLLKKSTKSVQDDTCQEKFEQLKQMMTSPPILCKTDTTQPLLVYIAATTNAIGATLVYEIDNDHKPVYFVSRTLQDPKTRYQMVDKVALSLVITTRRLKPYFQSHTIIVKMTTLYRRSYRNLTLWAKCLHGLLNCLSSTYNMNCGDE